MLARLVLLLALVAFAPAWAQDPALPPGFSDEEPEEQQEEPEQETWSDRLPEGLRGFVEARLGPRIFSDAAHSRDFTLAEARLQIAYDRAWKYVSFDAKADVILDAALGELDTDLRALRMNFRPPGPVDLSIGRQAMTWGTGDLLFINDLFPKDWQSYFIGRDDEYLKAPSDALRIGWFPGKVSIDLVYTPKFAHDRYISGERISFWDPLQADFRGDAQPVAALEPDDAFSDDEISARIYGSAGSFEIAGYAYRGFWKSPAGFDPMMTSATFPALDVWGASVRGPVGPGIGNVEVGYYDSRGDDDGTDPFTNNGEVRLLTGYEVELASELTGGFQLYLERMLDHDRYLDNLPGGEPRDENRYVVTTRITKLLKGQTLIPSVFLYYSPSDRDGYLRPKLLWKRSDRLIFEFGANIFFGRDDHTFFGQFEHNSNVYASMRVQP